MSRRVGRAIPKSLEAVQALVMRAGIAVNVTPRDRWRLKAHDYKRHGTTTLFVALDVLDGTAIGPQHEAAPPSAVHPLPQRYRDAGAEAKDHPRTSQGMRVARPASTLDLPLHPDLRILAQRCRKLLCQAHAPAPQTRCLPIRRRSEGCHQPLHCRQTAIQNPSPGPPTRTASWPLSTREASVKSVH